MILEGIVTTVDASGRLNVAPMGATVQSGMLQFLLRPFQTSATFQNLKATRQGVLHIVDDALLLTQATIGQASGAPTIPAQIVQGQILSQCCRYFEFRVVDIDESTERSTVWARSVSTGTLRGFWGWNRAKHAVIEAAILVSRLHLTGPQTVLEGLAILEPIVSKTGGPDEQSAFRLLVEHVQLAGQNQADRPS